MTTQIRAAVAGAFLRPADPHLMRHHVTSAEILARFPAWMIVDRRLSVAGGGE